MKGRLRRLEITKMGFWYIGLCIAFGVIALVSGNNVIYLLDSLLLAGMIFSGILSEREVSRARIELVRAPACAGERVRDRVLVQNLGKTPLFCLEIGEWSGRRFSSIAYVPRLGPRERLVVASRQIFERRGIHRWEGLAVATAFPFGFARKIRIEKEPGERVVWPARPLNRGARLEPCLGTSPVAAIPRVGSEFAEGEARPITPDDDCRSIIWTLSARGGEPLVRPRRSDRSQAEVTLDLRTEPGEPFEAALIVAAERFHPRSTRDEGALEGTLTLIDHRGRRKFHGKVQALNQLALAEPAGKAG